MGSYPAACCDLEHILRLKNTPQLAAVGIFYSSKWVHTPQLAANRNFLRLKNTPQLAAVGVFYLLSQTPFIQVENSTSTHLFLLSCTVSVPLTGTMSSFMFAGRKEKVIPSISASASQFSVEAYIFPKV